ncbi:MAG: 4Fe-4S dicluster domain-containing protein [Desulfobacteraceae bacterium]|nr:4Fe-4S dicluster domain-containing protein [Desulfobacteraceae bacterium]
MDVKRRNFLKIAGLSAAAGLGASSAFTQLFKGDALASEEGHGGETAGHAAPAQGEHKAEDTEFQYGMVIDIPKFAANKGLAEKCIAACHYEHNVPDFGNPKDEIKWIWLDDYEHSFPDASQYKRNAGLNDLPVLLTCNHCANPPCVRACPTQATFKNDHGVVIMDFHRCIGCRFCMAACPYGARSFNWRNPREQYANGNYKFFKHGLNPNYPTRMRGVVEKCNFCPERLAVGKPPACVEATGDTKAMVFGNINDPNSEIAKVLNSNFTIQRNPAAGTKPSVFYII